MDEMQDAELQALTEAFVTHEREIDGAADSETFTAGWIAGRDWERERAAAAAQAEEERLAEIREYRERGERLLHPERNPHSISYGVERS